MENTLLYGETWEVPEEDYTIQLGLAHTLKKGKDLTLIAHGRAAITSLKAAHTLQDTHNINAEVIDLRSIRPLDTHTILQSVRKTHRAFYIEENKPFCGIGAQISHLIQQEAFDDLDAPITRISALDTPQIYSPPLENLQIPTPERIIHTILTHT